jgi:hypothetical protein
MQHVFKTAPQANFSQISNSLIDSLIPATPQKVLLYLLSKPADWVINFNDIRKRLGLSVYSARKAMQWLQTTGYLFYQRLKSGRTIWRVYDAPQPLKISSSPDLKPRVEKPQVENQPYLITLGLVKTLKTTTPVIDEPTKNQTKEVVVSELIYPTQLSPEQKKAAKHVIKKVKQPELQQPVLFALAYYMAQGKVKSPVAYLNGLISRANSDTFEPVQSTKQETAAERIAREKKQKEEAHRRAMVNTETHNAWLPCMVKRQKKH